MSESAPATDDVHELPEGFLDHYWEHGYAVVPGLIDTASRQRWLDRLSDIVEGRVEPAEGMLVMKDVMVAKGVIQTDTPLEAIAKIQDYELDPVLDGYTTHPAILDVVQRIIGRDVMTIHTMLINKPPNVDGRHPIHQDLLYFPFRPADRIVASWTALEPVTIENGCLVVVPGSHRGELLEHGNPPDIEHLNGGYWGVTDADDALERRVHLEMEPGDTVFFHPVLLHGSGRNRTEGFRRAMSAHYASVDVTWKWNTDGTFANRRYRIVRGEGEGGFWQGERRSDDPINPAHYIKADAVNERIR